MEFWLLAAIGFSTLSGGCATRKPSLESPDYPVRSGVGWGITGPVDFGLRGCRPQAGGDAPLQPKGLGKGSGDRGIMAANRSWLGVFHSRSKTADAVPACGCSGMDGCRSRPCPPDWVTSSSPPVVLSPSAGIARSPGSTQLASARLPPGFRFHSSGQSPDWGQVRRDQRFPTAAMLTSGWEVAGPPGRRGCPTSAQGAGEGQR